MKKIYPQSKSHIVKMIGLMLIIIILIYASISTIVEGFNNDSNMFYTLPIIIGIISYLLYILFVDTLWHIEIAEDFIKAKKCQQQKPVIIYYNEIIDVDLVKSKLDSNDKYYSYGSTEGGDWIVDSLFIRFTCKNDIEKKLWVKRYTTVQINKLMSCIKSKMND